MKILFLADQSVNHTRRWVEYFAAAGHECHLLTFERGPAVPAEVHYIPSRLPRKFMLKYILNLPTVRRLARRIGPDVASAQELGSYGPLGILCGARPVCVSAWGTDVLREPDWSPFHRARIQFCLQNADLITSMADHMTARIIELGGHPGKIVVNHFGVDETVFTMTDRAPRAADDVVLIHTRHFKPVYNYEQLLAALPAVFEQLPAARMVFLSEGPLKASVEKRINDLGLAERVEFRGSLDAVGVAAALRDADIFLTTSRSDGANISLLEAMASGCYPVVTDIPATRQWFDAGAEGAAVQLDDAAALANAVVLAAADRDLRARARAANRQVVLDKGLWRVNMRKSEEALLDLVAAFPRSPGRRDRRVGT